MARLLVLLSIAYPALVYFGLASFDARGVALIILAVLTLRVILAAGVNWPEWLRAWWLPVASVASVALVTATWNEPRFLLLAPALVNAALFTSFVSSLAGESVVERIARLQTGELSVEETAYCRSVTRIWCGFFAANGAIALWLALLGDLESWTLYTGLIAYLLMGGLFAVELAYRHWRFRKYLGAATDPLFRWIFPPRETRGSAPRLGPEILDERRESEKLELDLRIPEDLDCWPGHFPGFAVVPGVLQLDWVVQAVTRWEGRPPEVTAIEALKFKTPLLPGQRARLRIETDATRNTFRFELRDADTVFSTGRIVLSRGEAGP